MKSSVPTESSPDSLLVGREGLCGDLLVVFGEQDPTGGRGTRSWVSLASEPGWEVWQQTGGASWRGVPLLYIRVPGWRVWLLGELFARDGSALKPEVFVRELLEGRRSATEFNGHALVVAYDERQRQWQVWTDRFGTLHAYYGRHGQTAAFGTCFDAVARMVSRCELDWVGLTGFFGCGFFPQDRTFYTDVRILRPACRYVFGVDGAELSVQRYWSWSHRPDKGRRYEDTVQQFGELFLKVMEEMLGCGQSVRQRIAVPISGGLDSRSTVAAIVRASPQLWSYSYGYSKDSIETRIARQVAAARAIPFSAFAIGPYLFDRLPQVMEAVEGFQDLTQCRQASIADDLRQRADYVIAAHWGDVWLDDMGLTPSGEDGGIQRSDSNVIEHTLGKLTKRGRGWLLENLCAPRLSGERPEETLRGFVAEGMRPLEGIADPDFRVKAFKTDNWSFRWTLASIRMFQAAAFPRLPFYDTRLADFFCTVPSEYVAGRRLQIDFLKRFAPDLAGIKWQVYDADLYSYHRFRTWHLPKRALKKVMRAISGEKVLERNWEVQFAGEQGEAGLRHWLLRPGLRLHDLVPKDRVESLFAAFRAAPLSEGRGYTVCMLLTLSVWLESR